MPLPWRLMNLLQNFVMEPVMTGLPPALPSCRFTEVDMWLYPTIIRYDACYAVLFKCSRRRISDYPHLQAWMRDIYQLQVDAASPSAMQIRDTFDVDDSRRSYFSSLFPLNPGASCPPDPPWQTSSLTRIPRGAPRTPRRCSTGRRSWHWRHDVVLLTSVLCACECVDVAEEGHDATMPWLSTS